MYNYTLTKKNVRYILKILPRPTRAREVSMRGLLHRVSCRIDTACTGVHNPASNDPPSHPTTLSIATGSYLRVPG